MSQLVPRTTPPPASRTQWIRRAQTGIKRTWKSVAPGLRAWKGAALGLWIGAYAALIVFTFNYLGIGGAVPFVIGTLAFLGLSALIGLLIRLMAWLLGRIPRLYGWALTVTLPAFVLIGLFAYSVIAGYVGAGLGFAVILSLLGAGIAVLSGGGWPTMPRRRRIITGGGLVLGVSGAILGGWWLFSPGSPTLMPVDAAGAVEQPPLLAMADPSQPGPYAVQTLFYGSGTDQRRAEYGEDVDLITQPVDGSLLLDGWSALRSRYWGFGPDSLPLNARVWYPDGAGPFPLVLIAHGNHPMEEYSDPGYGYLGELLASRGFIVASVDENFFNLSLAADLLLVNQLQEENDARAWLLLEHLSLWRAWTHRPDNPFYAKVDLDQIALIGHSRGGEAVAVAAAFNRLPYYPDDGRLAFDYGFNIRGVVAIAPIDGQYKPTDRPTPLEDVNYLVLHGAHDMDVISFVGARQYERVHFSGEDYYFKSQLYIYGANHGQFNTVWGNKDVDEPLIRLFNLGQLLSAQEQRQIAKVYMTAFLETALHGERGYLPLFRDHRVARAWLPQTLYLSAFHDSAMRFVSTYEEDMDLTTTTLSNGSQQGDHLTRWREQLVTGKWYDANTHAVFLGWDNRTSAEIPSYTITLPVQGLVLGEETVLVFSLADANENPHPNVKDQPKDRTPRQPIDLTIELADRAGEVSTLALGDFRLLQPQIEGQIAKNRWMNVALPRSEVVFQSFEAPLIALVQGNAAFDPGQLATIRFRFDRTPSGVVILDNVGFRAGFDDSTILHTQEKESS